MNIPPPGRPLADGRWHLQHGPIDLILQTFGAAAACRDAYAAAERRFATLLDELCAELPALRAPAGQPVAGVVARRMQAAVMPHATAGFITPMAAVAGAVADEVLAVMTAAAPLERAFVNNGGDIALYLAEGTAFRVGLIDRPDQPGLFGTTTIRAQDGIRGVATSGWRGRSFSLGIADAVTVLAASAAQADAAATVVANAVDLPGHPAVRRVPAVDVQCDSDLGTRLVTRDVGPLSMEDVVRALDRGVACAELLAARGLIRAAALHCQGSTRIAGRTVLEIEGEGCLR